MIIEFFDMVWIGMESVVLNEECYMLLGLRIEKVERVWFCMKWWKKIGLSRIYVLFLFSVYDYFEVCLIFVLNLILSLFFLLDCWKLMG